MSTHSLVSRRSESKCLPIFSLFGGLLIAWLAFSSTAFAAQLASDLPPSTPLGLMRAGVSVVRLLVTYDKTNNSGTVYCTGLGAIVASRPAQSSSDQNHWVLTDSSLVNTENQALCAAEHPQATLRNIEVYLSSAYNPQEITFQSAIGPGTVRCFEEDCHSGPVLFPLGSRAQNQLLPFIDLAPQRSTQEMGVALMASISGQPGLPTPSIADTDAQGASAFRTQAQLFRSPREISLTNTLEAGTPLINSNGQLAGLHLKDSSSKVTSTNIQSFMEKTIPDFTSPPSNTVHDGWQRGMDAYSRGDLNTAQREFQKAANANPNFQAVKDLASSSIRSTKNPSNSSNTITIAGVSISLWQLVIVIVALLAALLLAITVLIGRSRVRHQRLLEVEWKEAERQATIEAQQIAEIEAAQRAKAQQPVHEQPVQQSPVLVTAQAPARQLRCPRCGELVPGGANFCSNCSLFLSPSESGLHLRIQPQVASGPAVSTRSQADQPTMPPAPAKPVASVSEQPTVEMTPKVVREQPADLEKTQPYTKRQVSDDRFELMVGTRSDPGIKRKYKPNEDSLFAAQGMIDEASTSHPYGLFVIADGMGGHANGQDASRLAIQKIIEHILPKLLKDGPLPNDEYAKLLMEGIQNANLAVHQRNMEQRGDMGTTVTSALIVDNLAYIANVGDSRTYLYHEPDGLKKVTNDHSVVASLVEAGIIKPDDIYTHPKRSHIYRSLGEKPAVEVDLFTVQLQEADKLLLCSDGLWDMVRDPQIEGVIKNPDPNPSATGDALIQAALDGGGEDNVSVIVIHVTEPTKAASVPRIHLLAKPDTVQMPQL